MVFYVIGIMRDIDLGIRPVIVDIMATCCPQVEVMVRASMTCIKDEAATYISRSVWY